MNTKKELWDPRAEYSMYISNAFNLKLKSINKLVSKLIDEFDVIVLNLKDYETRICSFSE